MGIDGLSSSRELPTTPTRDYGQPAGQTGTFRGESVRPVDVQSTLADAAEEISMAYSEKVEDKELAERKVEAEPPFQVMSAEEIAAYLADSHAGDQAEKLASIVARMLSGHEAPKNAASRFSGDVTQQFVVVQHALREGQSNGTDASILEMLQEVIAEMAMEHGPAIQAGLNTCRAAGE